MMISDTELGLAIGYQRDLQAVAAHSQRIIDGVCAERDAALAEVVRLRAALATAQGELASTKFMLRRQQLRA